MIEIRDKNGKVTRKYHMPSHAHLMVEDGEQTYAGQVLAKIPRETTKTKASRAISTPRRTIRAVGTPAAARGGAPRSPEELEREREMQYFVEPEEAFTREAIE